MSDYFINNTFILLKIKKNISSIIFILMLANKKNFLKKLNLNKLIFYLKTCQDDFNSLEVKT